MGEQSSIFKKFIPTNTAKVNPRDMLERERNQGLEKMAEFFPKSRLAQNSPVRMESQATLLVNFKVRAQRLDWLSTKCGTRLICN